jgi:hypothetical protein
MTVGIVPAPQNPAKQGVSAAAKPDGKSRFLC